MAIYAGEKSKDQYCLIIDQGSSRKKKKLYSADIEHFVFGGFSSRFWLMQNYINHMPKHKDLPDSMLCWNMLSIHLKESGKTIDLILTSEMQMNILIQYLSQMLRTNSYKHRHHLFVQKLKEAKLTGKQSQAKLKEFEEKNLTKEIDFGRALAIYKVMRIRMKISYYAWKNGMTVVNYILHQIAKSFQELHQLKKVKPVCMDTVMIKTRMKDSIQYMYSRPVKFFPLQSLIDHTMDPHDKFTKKLKMLEDRRHLNQKFTRLAFYIFMHFLGVRFAHPYHTIQLQIEREDMIKDFFISQLHNSNQKFQRIPRRITQENLPMSFLFYNYSLTLIEELKQQFS